MKESMQKLFLKLGVMATMAPSLVSANPIGNVNPDYTTPDHDYLGVFSKIFKDSYTTGTTVIGGAIFLVVIFAVLSAFWQYNKGKKELGDVATIAAVGGIVMTVVFVLINAGSSTLGGS
ncbi:hypothetical protein A6E01_19225 (plasmid) [Vibrio breoganii]|uniref:Integrating conjugative element membrane protein n=2 Tax=Vibrio breoganii TaxID=553239 RepID=A0AAN1CUA4_9VIBR|nr:hypothetical protein A6E01_19225 [Vibrio breoganii]